MLRPCREVFAASSFLIIEPNDYLRKVTRAMLTVLGVECLRETGDPQQVIPLLDATPFTGIIMAWPLDPVLGLELHQRLNRPVSPALGSKPVRPILIGIAQEARRSDITLAYRLGFEAFLVRPFSVNSLFRHLYPALKQRHHTSAPKAALGRGEDAGEEADAGEPLLSLNEINFLMGKPSPEDTTAPAWSLGHGV